jgi:hypothetical protein
MQFGFSRWCLEVNVSFLEKHLFLFIHIELHVLQFPLSSVFFFSTKLYIKFGPTIFVNHKYQKIELILILKGKKILLSQNTTVSNSIF